MTSDIIDCTQTLSRDPGWYNFDDSGLKPIDQPWSSPWNLHYLRSLEDPLPCCIQVCHGQDHVELALCDDTILTFSVGGGAEIPHFKLNLILTHPQPGKNLSFTAIWTAWSEKGFDRPRAEQPDIYTFSNRLQNVKVKPSQLDISPFPKRLGEDGGPCWLISWDSEEPPYCYNFGLTAKDFATYTPRQFSNFKVFRGMAQRNIGIRLVTQKRGRFAFDWTFMTVMPWPTPPPFPNYDCRYNRLNERLEPISILRIPPLDNETLVAHYAMRLGSRVHRYFGGETFIGQLFPTPLTFINERHYEVVKSIAILREHDHIQTLVRHRNQNQTYTFRLEPLAVDLAPSGSSYCIIDMALESGNGFCPGSDLELPSPALGSLAWITISHRTFQGVVIMPPEELRDAFSGLVNPVCIIIASGDYVSDHSQEVTGKLTLSPPMLLLQQTTSALRAVLYGDTGLSISSDNTLKDLLLAHECSPVDNLDTFAVLNPKADQHIVRFFKGDVLDESQIRAMRLALCFGRTPQDKYRSLFSLIIGQPGTGKTRVSAHISAFCFLQNWTILIVGSSESCLDALEETIIMAPLEIELLIPLEGVYRLDLELGEDHERQMARAKRVRTLIEENIYPQQIIDELKIATCLLDNLRPLLAWIAARTSSYSAFSMGRHITERLEEYWEGDLQWRLMQPQTECCLLDDVLMWHCALMREGCVFDEPSGRDCRSDEQPLKDRLILGFRHALGSLERFYISHARAILCTISHTTSHVLPRWQPQLILIEDACFMAETVCLSTIVRHYAGVEKIILTGDLAQAPTLTSFFRNEYFESERMSLLRRFRKTHVPCVRLKVQYRITPEIYRFISNRFYNGAMHDGPDRDRPTADLFRKIMMTIATDCRPSNLYFASVNTCSVWQRKDDLSIFNPEYVCFIAETVDKFIKGGIEREQILILSDYAEERRALGDLLCHLLEGSRVEIRGIKSIEGRQKEVVILSTTRPGGPLSLGSVADMQRQCLAMSRAMDGLLIVGHKHMAEEIDSTEHPRHRYRDWRSIIKYMITKRALTAVKGDRGLLEKSLGIPNPLQYVELLTGITRPIQIDGDVFLDC
ncbi:P-loop containing nucleoside triphosphate hydrolase protein [Aspergillus cavernicola]|uniref:P-loop containing nucleoside triphosphate hydrolase protein n=1 Tax=Aspergillus cavernicola TaxID=176166 RepID=A0ABR4IRC6_9EURO